jgi:hypothetical protein
MEHIPLIVRSISEFIVSVSIFSSSK